MRFWLLLCLALIPAGIVLSGCTATGTPVPPTATLRGPVVPTRLIPSDTPTPTPTDTFTPTLTDTPTTTPTFTLTPAPTETPTPIPPSETPTRTATPIPSETATPIPTETFTATTIPTTTPPPTEMPTMSPSATSEPTLSIGQGGGSLSTDAVPSATLEPTLLPSAPPTPGEALGYRNSTALEPVTLSDPVTLDQVVSGTIDNQHPARLYPLTGTAGTVLDVAMKASSGNLDPFLIVLDPKGREIARDDDVSSDDHNAAITGLVLPEHGVYVIVAGRFDQMFGENVGDFELNVTSGSATTPVTGTFATITGYNSLVNGSLDSTHGEDLYTFRAAAGDVITIQMSHSSGDLDPHLTLTDNLGNPLMSNDDNLLIETFDSAIQGYIARRAGYYTIIASRYTGNDNSGSYRLKLVRDGQNESGVYAPLDPVNSQTINDSGDAYINYSAGDIIADDGTEHALQTLLTFRLPPPPNQLHVQSATLEVEPCYERGGGFAVLGDLTIYRENIGRLSQARNIGRPLPGARILTTQASCDPLDVTALVQNLYAINDPNVQFRLLFRDRADNGVEDQVQFTPRLLLTFTSN